MEDVCNMDEVLTLELHKDHGKYYMSMISGDKYASRVGLMCGIWTDTKAIPKDLLSDFEDVVKRMVAYSRRG